MLIPALLIAGWLGGATKPAEPFRLDWPKLVKAWNAYRARPSSELASRVYRLMPPDRRYLDSPHYGDPLYESLEWLEPRILSGDRWATRIAFRLDVLADAHFAEELHSILGRLIRVHPLLFLEELKRNRPAVTDISAIVLSLDLDEFADASLSARKAEYEARLDTLSTLELADLDLMDLRDECRSLLGEEIVHGLNGEP